MRNSPVSRTEFDLLAEEIRVLKERAMRQENQHEPTVPLYPVDFPDDPIQGQIALAPGTDLNVSANIANSGTQSITSGSFVPAVFDTEVWDTGGLADLGTHNDRLTVQTDGLYLVHGEAIWFANADSAYRNTVCQAYAAGGGLSYSWAQSFANVNGENTIQNPSGLLQLTAGMYVRLLVYNGSGGSRTLGACYLSLCSLSAPGLPVTSPTLFPYYAVRNDDGDIEWFRT